MRPSRLLPCALLLTLSPLLFSSSGRDDSYLTYWPARVLATQGQIHNYNGERVEQSSTLLHVVLIAAAERVLPLPIPSSGPLLSLACGVIALLLTHRVALLLHAPAAGSAALITALSAPFLYWSASGMESTLAASITLWFLLVAHAWLSGSRGPAAIAFLAALAFVSVRPENPVVLAGTALVFATVGWIGRRRRVPAVTQASVDDRSARRDGARFACIILLAFVSLAAFRLLYFHTLFPEPVYAKGSGLSSDTILGGLAYLGRNTLGGFTALLWLICTGTVSRALLHPERQAPGERLALLLSCFVVTYTAFVACSGGDWMEAGRFLVPVLPLVIVLSVVAVWQATSARLSITVTVILAGLQLCDTALLFRSPQNFGGPLWRHFEDIRDTDRFSWFEMANELHAGYADLIPALERVIDDIRVKKPDAPVVVLTGQMGMVPYHVAQRSPDLVRWVDIRGLADRRVITCPATRDLARTPYGIAMTYPEFFRRRADIRPSCDFADPDVIFDRAPNRDFEAMLTQNGYRVVFREKKRWFQWIAVRQDLE